MKYKAMYMFALWFIPLAHAIPEEAEESGNPVLRIRNTFSMIDPSRRLALVTSLCEGLDPEDQMKLNARLFCQATNGKKLSPKSVAAIASQVSDMQRVLACHNVFQQEPEKTSPEEEESDESEEEDKEEEKEKAVSLTEQFKAQQKKREIKQRLKKHFKQLDENNETQFIDFRSLCVVL